MPLNTNTPDEKNQNNLKFQPVNNKQKEKAPLPPRLMAVIFTIIVVAAIVFILYKAGLFKTDDTSSSNVQELSISSNDTLSNQQTQNIPTDEINKEQNTVKSDETPVIKQKQEEKAPNIPQMKLPDESTEQIKFTIYVGSFKNKRLAESELARLKESNYDAYITRAKGMFRVSIGKYSTREQAKSVAEKLKEIAESGYWVDTIK